MRWTLPMAWSSCAEFSTGSTSRTWVASIKLRPFAPEWIGNNRTLTSPSLLKLWRFSWHQNNHLLYFMRTASTTHKSSNKYITRLKCRSQSRDHCTVEGRNQNVPYQNTSFGMSGHHSSMPVVPADLHRLHSLWDIKCWNQYMPKVIFGTFGHWSSTTIIQMNFQVVTY